MRFIFLGILGILGYLGIWGYLGFPDKEKIIFNFQFSIFNNKYAEYLIQRHQLHV